MYVTTGIIKTLRDGIAEVSGLHSVQSGELVVSLEIRNMGLVIIQKQVPKFIVY